MTAESERHIWILGLMHSGTTIVWRAWRKDRRFLCFDEPLSGLDVVPGQNSRRSYGEFISLFREDPLRFWKKYAPLHPMEELDAEFTARQREWLSLLLSRSRLTVIDETHLHLHLHSLRDLSPDAHVIHLYRRASAFVTSHLLPSVPRTASVLRRTAKYLRNRYNRFLFWGRDQIPTELNRHQVIGSNPRSKFGLLLAASGYDSERIMAAPAVVRLLAYWHFHFHYIEREAPMVFGSRFRTLSYEAFARDPVGQMRELYDWIGMDSVNGIDYREVHPPKPAFREKDRRWVEAARIAGFSDEEIERLL